MEIKEEIDNLKVLEPDVQQLTIKDAILKNQLNDEAKNEIKRINETEKQ